MHLLSDGLHTSLIPMTCGDLVLADHVPDVNPPTAINSM